jgi:hypothetical protein
MLVTNAASALPDTVPQWNDTLGRLKQHCLAIHIASTHNQDERNLHKLKNLAGPVWTADIKA